MPPRRRNNSLTKGSPPRSSYSPTPVPPLPPVPPTDGLTTSSSVVSSRQILLSHNEVLAMTSATSGESSQKRFSDDMTEESSILRSICSSTNYYLSGNNNDVIHDDTTMQLNDDHLNEHDDTTTSSRLYSSIVVQDELIHNHHHNDENNDGEDESLTAAAAIKTTTTDTAAAIMSPADESVAARRAVEESRLMRERSRQILQLTRNNSKQHRFSDLTTDSSLMFTTVIEELGLEADEGDDGVVDGRRPRRHRQSRVRRSIGGTMGATNKGSKNKSSLKRSNDDDDNDDDDNNSDMISNDDSGGDDTPSTQSLKNCSPPRQRDDDENGWDNHLHNKVDNTIGMGIINHRYYHRNDSITSINKRWSDLTDESSMEFLVASARELRDEEKVYLDVTSTTVDNHGEGVARRQQDGDGEAVAEGVSSHYSSGPQVNTTKRSSGLLYDPNLSEEMREKSRQILRWTNCKKRLSDSTSKSLRLTDIMEAHGTGNVGSSSDITGASSSLAISVGFASIISTDGHQQLSSPTNQRTKLQGAPRNGFDDTSEDWMVSDSKEVFETPKVKNSKGSVSAKLKRNIHSRLNNQESSPKGNSASSDFKESDDDDEEVGRGKAAGRKPRQTGVDVDDEGGGSSPLAVGVLRDPPRSLSLQSPPHNDTKPRRTAVTVRMPNGELSTEGMHHPGAIAIGGIAGADTGQSEHSIQVSMRSIRTSVPGNNNSNRNNASNKSARSLEQSQRTVTATAISEADLVQEIFQRYTSAVIPSEETEPNHTLQSQQSDQYPACTASSVMVSEAEMGDVTASSGCGLESDELVSIRASIASSTGGGGLLLAASRQRKKNKMKALQTLIGVLIVCCCTLEGVIIVILTRKSEAVRSTAGSVDPTNITKNDESDSASSIHQLKSSIQTIRDRGYVICRGETFDVMQEFGISYDLCSAIAAAIFGDPKKYEVVSFPFREQFPSIANGTVDISTAQTTPTMHRDIREPVSQQGVTFSTPYFYSGSTFVGIPEFVECAVQGDTLVGECRFLSVCVLDGSVQADFVRRYLGGSVIHSVAYAFELIERLYDGTCNVIPENPLSIHSQTAGVADFPFVVAPILLEVDPLALTTRNNDPEFGDLVNWVLRALVAAEALGITQDTAHLFPTTNLFGEDKSTIFQDAIAAAGNYGELYSRHWEAIIPRTEGSINSLHVNGGDGGLLYAYPLGNVDLFDETAKPAPNGTLYTINNREQFYCGIHVGRPGFASWNETARGWSGIDVDFCRGLAAALFAGLVDHHLILVPFNSLQDGFVALKHRVLDVFSGAIYNIENDIREPKTGIGFAFSDVYYYHEETDGEGVDVSALAMATREDDSQWTDFVRSMVKSTIYAEAHAISKASAETMPILELFGPLYRQALRDVILSIGNYAELYVRNMEVYVPRVNTRNTLNNGNTPLFFAHWKF